MYDIRGISLNDEAGDNFTLKSRDVISACEWLLSYTVIPTTCTTTISIFVTGRAGASDFFGAFVFFLLFR